MRDEDTLNRIEARLEKMDEKLDSHGEMLAAIRVTLPALDLRTTHIEDAMIPLIKHDNMAQGTIKFLGFLAAVAVAIGALLPFIKLRLK